MNCKSGSEKTHAPTKRYFLETSVCGLFKELRFLLIQNLNQQQKVLGGRKYTKGEVIRACSWVHSAGKSQNKTKPTKQTPNHQTKKNPRGNKRK